MKRVTINRFQMTFFTASADCLFSAGWTVEQLAQYLHIRHVWATDNLYKLPSQEGATVIIQSNAN